MRMKTWLAPETDKLDAYSHATAEGPLVFVSAMTGVDFKSGDMSRDVTAQAEQCLHNVGRALRQMRATMDDVVRVRVVLGKRGDYDKVRAVLKQHFDGARPALSVTVGDFVDSRTKVTVEVTAYRELDA